MVTKPSSTLSTKKIKQARKSAIIKKGRSSKVLELQIEVEQLVIGGKKASHYAVNNRYHNMLSFMNPTRSNVECGSFMSYPSSVVTNHNSILLFIHIFPHIRE